MHFVRSILGLLALIAFVVLSMLNWDTITAVRIWPGYVWDTRLPAVIVAAFLLGLIPTWLIHRGTKWQLNRRIGHLESAARNAATTRPVDTPPPPQPLSPAPPLHDLERPLP